MSSGHRDRVDDLPLEVSWPSKFGNFGFVNVPTALTMTFASMVSTPSGVSASRTHTSRASSNVALTTLRSKRVLSCTPYFFEIMSRYPRTSVPWPKYSVQR